jgi:hypothetical protein
MAAPDRSAQLPRCVVSVRGALILAAEMVSQIRTFGPQVLRALAQWGGQVESSQRRCRRRKAGGRPGGPLALDSPGRGRSLGCERTPLIAKPSPQVSPRLGPIVRGRPCREAESEIRDPMSCRLH